MLLFYRVFTNLLYPIFIIIIFLRKFFKKEDNKRYKEKIFYNNFNAITKSNLNLIWFQAASIGELKSILPILDSLNKQFKNLEFLITTTTLSSGNLAKKELKRFHNAQHRFFPIDIKFLINKFLSAWKPKAIFFVDSEIWPNLILQAREKNIPLVLINARITLKTFKRWMLVPDIAKKIFSCFSLCLSSSKETEGYLKDLNAKNVSFSGNLKLIGEIDKSKLSYSNINILEKNRFWLAASTHEGEESLCLKTHLFLKKKYNNVKTIIAPRHIERSNRIRKLCESYNLTSQVLNLNETILNESEIIIINTFGVLSSFYKHAKSVFIGKSTIKKLESVGGQNPVDAAKSGCKIYHGPYVYNFKEIYAILEKNNISNTIESSTELGNFLIKDLEDYGYDNKKFPSLMNDLGQKTLTDTMTRINNFMTNETK